MCVQGEKKERFNEIKQELSQISTKFSNNLLVRPLPDAFHGSLPGHVFRIPLRMSNTVT